MVKEYLKLKNYVADSVERGSHYQVHPSRIAKWKKQALEILADAFRGTCRWPIAQEVSVSFRWDGNLVVVTRSERRTSRISGCIQAGCI